MTKEITIQGITANTPVDIYVCNTFEDPPVCELIVSGQSEFPYTFEVNLTGEGTYYTYIVDQQGCEIFQEITLCYCFSAINYESIDTVTYFDCNGTENTLILEETGQYFYGCSNLSNGDPSGNNENTYINVNIGVCYFDECVPCQCHMVGTSTEMTILYLDCYYNPVVETITAGPSTFIYGSQISIISGEGTIVPDCLL